MLRTAQVVHVFPRRRKGKGPVSLTLEILKCFAGIPLYEAASRMGICETALKSACRKLGVKKWVSMKAISCDASCDDAECGNALCDVSCDAKCDALCDNAPCDASCDAPCDANFSPDGFFIE
jgi:hypothetical protein